MAADEIWKLIQFQPDLFAVQNRCIEKLCLLVMDKVFLFIFSLFFESTLNFFCTNRMIQCEKLR